MEGGEGVTATVPVAASSPPPPEGPDFSPVSSPETVDTYMDNEVPPRPSDEPFPPASTAATLTDDLRDKIIKQAEYYFSDENLLTDKFLMKYVTKNKEGFVPVAVIASFRKMKKLTKDSSLIVAALRASSSHVVSPDGKQVKRLNPLPLTEVKDPQLCTVLVENLPEDHSIDNIQRIFGVAGRIKNVCLRDPNEVREPRKRTIAEKLLSGKLHALVEYETLESAEQAVATLNNEQDWRYGMRVKLLKKLPKREQKKKEHNETKSEKKKEHNETKSENKKEYIETNTESNVDTQISAAAGDEENHNFSERIDEIPDEGDAEHKLEKNGERTRNRGRGRRHKYRGTNGHGHGTVSTNHGIEISKPPPGPRMPDGTRGFTMGRGRPLASNQN